MKNVLCNFGRLKIVYPLVPILTYMYIYSQLTNRLLGDVMQDYISNLKLPPESVDGGIEVKYTKLLHNMRMRARKLLQFAR